MQDGATHHRVNAAFYFASPEFQSSCDCFGYPDKFGGGLGWPANSPDINPMDFSSGATQKMRPTKEKSQPGNTFKTQYSNLVNLTMKKWPKKQSKFSWKDYNMLLLPLVDTSKTLFDKFDEKRLTKKFLSFKV